MAELNLWEHFTDSHFLNGMTDAYDRHSYILDRKQQYFDPIVSNRIHDMGFRPEYPDGREFGVCLSHDVDFLYRRYGQKLKQLAMSLIEGDFNSALGKTKRLHSRGIEPEWDLENLTRIEDRFGAKSTMYFLSLDQTDEDFNYALNEIQDVFGLLKEKGHEIGLHGGHKAYNNLEQLKIEKKRLEEAAGVRVKGYRNHFLRFSNPLTWNNLREAGFEHDSTFGYSDAPGFRNGMCYPFKPFDNEKGSFIDLIEIPLIAMDVSFSRTMKMDVPKALEFAASLVQKVKRIGGVFTFLFHNSQDDLGFNKFYTEMLDHLDSQGAWLTTSQSMADWWKSQGYIDEVEKYLREIRETG